MATMFRVQIFRIDGGERPKKTYEKLRDRLNDKEPDNYGYLTETLPFSDSIQVYEQIVESVDIGKVIAAVNGAAK